MKHLLKMLDLSKEDITGILDLADRLKAERKQGANKPYLAGKTLGMIFQKPSTRTRVSFEAGMFQLGGHALFLSANDLQIGRGEPVKDTARVLSRYLDGIMIRTFAQNEVEVLAEYSTIPVINGLTDFSHPCQVLADPMTLRERLGPLEGKKAAFIGDGNNMANSLIVGCLKMGMKFAAACPKGYTPDEKVLAFAKGWGSAFSLTESPVKAASGASALFTDVWASMGQEREKAAREAVFAGKYRVDAHLLSLARPDCVVQHCLPAHRDEEITEEVFEKHADEIFDEAENRLHVQKAVMVLLMGGCA